jgi:hypothetical protein
MNLLFSLILLVMPFYIQALSLGEFICQSAKICGRPPTVQEFCDVFDLCFDGIKKTPPTPLEVLNKKLNLTNICNDGLSMVDVEIIQRQYSVLFSPLPTNPPTTVSIPTTTAPYVPETQPLSPEIITLIVLGSLTGFGLLVGLGLFCIRKRN